MPSYIDFINEAFKNKNLVSAQNEANKATQELTTLQGQLPNYLENKQRELVAADPQLQQLNAERAKFAGQLYSKPFEARQQYADIFDPVKREALVSQAIGNIVGQLSGTEGMIGLRKQKSQDLAQQAYNILQSQIDIAKSKAGSAQDRANRIQKILETAAGKQYDLASSKELARYKAGLDKNTTTTNPEKYKIKYNYDRQTGKYSGVTFLNDKGQKIPAVKYSVDTNTPLDSLLVGSGNPQDEQIAALIQEARNNGQSEKEILNDLLVSGQYNHLFGITSSQDQSTIPGVKQNIYNTGILGEINKLGAKLFPNQQPRR